MTKNEATACCVSLCMIVKNESLLIGQAIESAKPFVNEIVVVDTGSTDGTPDIAKRLGSRVIKYKIKRGLGEARNVYMKEAAGDWIFVLDADEAISKRDIPKLKKLILDNKTLGFIFPIRNYSRTHDLLRHWRCNDGSYPKEEKISGCPGYSLTKRIRLLRKKTGVFYQEGYLSHTGFLESLAKQTGQIKECDVAIHHFQFLKGTGFIDKKQSDALKNEMKHLKLYPDTPWAHLNIGITLFSHGKDKKAIAYLKKAVKYDPKLELAYFVLGLAYKENGDNKNAVLNLSKALDINPRYSDALTVLGIIYYIQGKTRLADKALRKALKINPSCVLAHNALGLVYGEMSEDSKAEDEYRKAISLNPYFPDAYFNLGLLYQDSGKLKKAVKFYKRYLEFNPRDAVTRRKLTEAKRQV